MYVDECTSTRISASGNARNYCTTVIYIYIYIRGIYIYTLYVYIHTRTYNFYIYTYNIYNFPYKMGSAKGLKWGGGPLLNLKVNINLYKII